MPKINVKSHLNKTIFDTYLIGTENLFTVKYYIKYLQKITHSIPFQFHVTFCKFPIFTTYLYVTKNTLIFHVKVSMQTSLFGHSPRYRKIICHGNVWDILNIKPTTFSSCSDIKKIIGTNDRKYQKLFCHPWTAILVSKRHSVPTTSYGNEHFCK